MPLSFVESVLDLGATTVNAEVPLLPGRPTVDRSKRGEELVSGERAPKLDEFVPGTLAAPAAPSDPAAPADPLYWRGGVPAETGAAESGERPSPFKYDGVRGEPVVVGDAYPEPVKPVGDC